MHMKLSEAMRIIDSCGLVVEDYPGEGYKRPILQMVKEIREAGKISELRERLISKMEDEVRHAIRRAFGYSEIDGLSISSDTYSASTLRLKNGYASTRKELVRKVREAFQGIRENDGIPIYLRSRGSGSNGWYWFAYFNLLSDDDGHIKDNDIAQLCANDDKYWDVLDDVYTKRTNKSEPYKIEKGSDEEKVEILYDAVYDNDKRSGRTAYLHLASSKEGDDETCYDGSKDTGLRGCSRCDTECDGKRQSHNTYNYTCKQVLNKCLFVVTVLES